jgi:hypothetical protein
VRQPLACLHRKDRWMGMSISQGASMAIVTQQYKKLMSMIKVPDS